MSSTHIGDILSVLDRIYHTNSKTNQMVFRSIIDNLVLIKRLQKGYNFNA